MFDIEIIDDRARFAAMRDQWTALLGSSRSDCLFLTWQWLFTWYAHLGESRPLFIVAVRLHKKLVALAPLMMTRTFPPTCEFLGTGSVGSDYLDFIVDGAHEAAATGALRRFLESIGCTLRLRSVREDSIVAAALEPSRTIEMQVCPYIELPDSFESYLATVGPSHRYNFRRRLRNLEKSYEVRFERAESDYERHTALQHVISLHLQRWSARGGSDGFHDERLLAFHDEFTAIAQKKGWLRLRLLKLDGRVAGAFYGFRYGGSYSFYQSGFDETFAAQSVGLVTIGLTIKDAIEEGAAEYDFLHGDESYKFLWTSTVRPLHRMEVFPRGVVGSMHHRSVVAIAATKRIVKRALDVPLHR